MDGGKLHNGIANIDHPVIAARDLDAARVIYERLGFTVPPRGSHVEWGTGNLCIMFPDDYLELRGIIDASRFTMYLDTHLEQYGEGLMGVAFGTPDVRSSHAQAASLGIDTGELRQLTRNFEHPEGWTQPSFELYAPGASDIEGLMHVVVIQHLTPGLIRRPEFLQHANSCIGVDSMAGTIYDVESCAEKMRRLLGDRAVAVTDDGILLQLPTAQHIELLQADAYESIYGAIAPSPEPETPRLGAMTLSVSDLSMTQRHLQRNGIDYVEPRVGLVRVAGADTCGVVLQFTETLHD